jgi:hypothetical protein
MHKGYNLLLTLSLLSSCGLPAFAFDYSVGFTRQALKGEQYPFSIHQIIDARANKQKAIG